jgi:hypothetical protein
MIMKLKKQRPEPKGAVEPVKKMYVKYMTKDLSAGFQLSVDT